jgi:hypothetical protein
MRTLDIDMLRLRLIETAAAAILLMVITAGCGKPGVNDLRDSFAGQLAANKYVKDFQKNGDDLLFTGPGADGTVIKWRVHIDSAVIEPIKDSGKSYDSEKPYKGTVKSSWYAGDYKVMPDRYESNLPLELISTGLAQDCWAAWNKTTKKWEWE